MAQKVALVIDDEPDIVKEVQFTLKKELQYLVLAATDAETAVDLSKSYAFDLLVLDLHMPKLDGFQVLEEVRKKHPQVKVIVITGFYDQYKDRYKSAKVDKIIEKPIDPKKFVKEVVAIAGKTDKPEAKEPNKVVNAKILIVDDEKEFCETFKECLAPDLEWLKDPLVDYKIEFANDGNEGISMNNQFEPDILIFDYKMPHMNGLEMISHIKRGNGHKPRLCIAFSADDYKEVIEEFKSRGIPFFSKPFRPEEVIEFLREKCLELGLYTTANE